ncbi:NIPSNAP family protein [Bosea thiooxidans]
MIRPSSKAAPDTVFELRRYRLKPGQRDSLITLFDAEFVETQEAAGMSVIGQFRDRAQPDQFVWLRGFADHIERNAALPRFYGGPVWAEHGPAANATMIDSDDVLMLKPVGATPAFADLPPRPAGAFADTGRLILQATHHLPPDLPEEGARRAAAAVAALAQAAGTIVLASFISDHSPNGFPRLPVRAEANAVVTVVRPPSGRFDAVAERLKAASADVPILSVEIAGLMPTARSRLR